MDQFSILEEECIAEERAVEAARLGAAITQRPVKALQTLKQPVRVAPSASIRQTVGLMNERGVGCVLVVEEGRLVGIFTERDVLTKVITLDRDIDRTPVGEVMTRDPECLTLDDGIAYALNLMSDGGFRHIPLVDGEGRPTGIVAMRNVVEYIVDLFPNEVRNLPPRPTLGIAREREGA
jgi:CBS domain-containing protein